MDTWQMQMQYVIRALFDPTIRLSLIAQYQESIQTIWKPRVVFLGNVVLDHNQQQVPDTAFMWAPTPVTEFDIGRG